MFNKNFPFYRQLDSSDCGPTCLKIIAQYYGKSLSLKTLRAKCNISRGGVSFLGISNAAESIGLHTIAVRINFKQLKSLVKFPCIVHLTPDGKKIVYRQSTRAIDIINSDGTNHQNLIQYAVGKSVYDIKISPAYDYIIYGIGSGTHSNGVAIQDLYKINFDGSNEINLTDSLGSAFYQSISNDGQYITFSSYRYKTKKIYIMDSDGENMKFLINGTNSKFQPTI